MFELVAGEHRKGIAKGIVRLATKPVRLREAASHDPAHFRQGLTLIANGHDRPVSAREALNILTEKVTA